LKVDLTFLKKRGDLNNAENYFMKASNLGSTDANHELGLIEKE
jgi:hypothetical protein